MKTITTSEIRAYKRCREEHRFSYALGYRTHYRGGALAFGTVVHAGLEAWWRGLPLAGALEALHDSAFAEGLDDYEQAKAAVMLEGYDARWGSLRGDFEVLHVEHTFRVLRGLGSYQLGGKFDALAVIEGQPIVVEHKTTSEDIGAGSDYWARLTLDDQVGNYLAAAEALGYRAGGVLYDVLKKPSVEPLRATPPDKRRFKKDGTLYANQREDDEPLEAYRARLVEALAEAPQTYFARQLVVRFDEETARANRDTDRIAAEILRVVPDEPQPRSPDACKRYGRMCEYFDVCTGAASLDDSARFRRTTNPHEEL